MQTNRLPTGTNVSDYDFKVDSDPLFQEVAVHITAKGEKAAPGYYWTLFISRRTSRVRVLPGI